MNTLIINAQPDYKNDAHYSIQLMNHFIGLFKEKYPNDTLEIRNLAGEWIPRATMDELLTVRGKQIAKKPLTEQEEKVAQRTDELLNDFMSFHRIVIVMPLHNFNIPSILKDYMDNILVARKTFKYTPEGLAGLMTDDRRVLLLQASGSIRSLPRSWGLTHSRLSGRRGLPKVPGKLRGICRSPSGSSMRNSPGSMPKD